MSGSKKTAPILYINYYSPPCHAVLLTAKYLGIKAVEKNMDFVKEEHKSEAFLLINPAHTIPALDDNGFRIWESRAIMGYLVQQYGKNDLLYPKDPKKRALIDNMLYFDAATLYTTFASYYYPIVFESKKDDEEKKTAFLEKLDILEKIMGNREFAAGDFLSLADFSVVVSVSAMMAAGIRLDKYPNTKKWVERVKVSIPVYGDVMDDGYKNYVSMFKDHPISQ